MSIPIGSELKYKGHIISKTGHGQYDVYFDNKHNYIGLFESITTAKKYIDKNPRSFFHHH